MVIRWRLADDTYLLAGRSEHSTNATKAAADALLPALLGIPGKCVHIRRAPGLKPVIDGPNVGWLSRAHRSGATLVAASRHAPIGADLEVTSDTVPHRDIADLLFDPAEATWLDAQPAISRANRFCAMWTIKEAVLKCIGTGIVHGMTRPCLDRQARTALGAMGDEATVHLEDHRIRLFRRQLGVHSMMAAIATPLSSAG